MKHLFKYLQKHRLAGVARLVIAAIALSALAWPAIADPPKISRSPDFADPVSGSCKAFVKATVRGVRDNEGIVHTGACGFTRFRPLFNGLDQADFFDAVRTGLFDPPFKVESFAGDVSKDAGRFCARAFDFAIDFGAEVQVSMLDWQHGKKPDSECAKEWQRLKRIIRNHEEKHPRDVKPVLDAATARLRQLNPISCAASNKAAVDGLAPMIVTALDAWFKSIKDDWDARQRSLDNSGVDRCEIDCSKCNDKNMVLRFEIIFSGKGETAQSQGESSISWAMRNVYSGEVELSELGLGGSSLRTRFRKTNSPQFTPPTVQQIRNMTYEQKIELAKEIQKNFVHLWFETKNKSYDIDINHIATTTRLHRGGETTKMIETWKGTAKAKDTSRLTSFELDPRTNTYNIFFPIVPERPEATIAYVEQREITSKAGKRETLPPVKKMVGGRSIFLPDVASILLDDNIHHYEKDLVFAPKEDILTFNSGKLKIDADQVRKYGKSLGESFRENLTVEVQYTLSNVPAKVTP